MKKFLSMVLFLALCHVLGAQESSMERHTFKYQGVEREYYLQLPETPCQGRPLVFMLHGYGGNGKDYFPSFITCAQANGFTVCCPQGLRDPGRGKPGWNVGYAFEPGWKIDDAGFIIALSKYLCKHYGLDRRNVFFSGMSNGGEMCYLMAHRYPEKFAAIASLAGLTMEWIYDGPKPEHPVPFMEIHGTEDRTSAWEGDLKNEGGWGSYISVPAAVGRMISTNNCTCEVCDTLPLRTPESHQVVRHYYDGSDCGAEVVLYEVIGGKHSRGEADLDVPATLLDFFKRHMK